MPIIFDFFYIWQINFSTDGKSVANRIFDIKYRVYGWNKFIQIDMNSTRVNAYNTRKNLE